MKDIFKETYKKAIKYADNYLWYTNWQVVLKDIKRLLNLIDIELIDDWGDKDCDKTY